MRRRADYVELCIYPYSENYCTVFEAADQHNILRLSTLQHIYCIIGVSFTVVYMMRIVKIPCYFDFCLREKVDWQPKDGLCSETDQNFEFFT